MAKKKDTTKNTDKAPVKVSTLILKKARITEKAANKASANTYVFDVAPTATKSEIAKAFQAAYKYRPLKVNLVTQKPKSYWRRGVLGFGSRGKKAYIILAKGQTIEVI